MTLRRRFQIYLGVVHLVFGACAWAFLRENPVWLLAVEGGFVLTFAVGLRLLGSFFRPLDLIRSGAGFLRDGDFNSRLRTAGQPDMDELVLVYNQMADRLRDERVRVEEQEHLVQMVLHESPGGVVTLDVEGRITTVNPAAETLLGAETADLQGRRLEDLATLFANALAELPLGTSRLLSLRGRRRVRCQRRAFMDRGFPRHFLLLDELTAELRRTEKRAYEELIRLMSHEVNNTSGAVQSLLQTCLTYAEQLAADDREDFMRALKVSISRTANLDAFVREFAAVVRLPKPRPRPADLTRLLDQVTLLFRDRAEAAGIVLTVAVPVDLPSVACDEVQFEQALMNIVKNAVEAVEETGAAGEVALAARVRDGRVVLTVSDTGAGLTTEVQAQTFTPFYTTKSSGQGVGLTMVQEILLGHGFEFALENGPDQGAVFTIVC